MPSRKGLPVITVIVVLLLATALGSIPLSNGTSSSTITDQWLNQKLVEWKPTTIAPMNFGALLGRASYDNINYYSYNTPQVENADLKMLESMGISYVRIDIGYDAWLQGNVTIQTEITSLVNQVRTDGKSLIVADAAAESYRPKNGGNIAWSQFKTAWVQRVTTLASLYMPAYYIVIKEPGWYAPMILDVQTNPLVQSPTEWLGLTQNLTNAVHSVSPNTKVGISIAADSLGSNPQLYEPYLQGLAGITGLSFVGFDIYTTTGFDNTQSFLSQHGSSGKDVWIAECWSGDGTFVFDASRAALDAKWMTTTYYFAQLVHASMLIPFYSDLFASYGTWPTSSAQIVSWYSQRTPVFYSYQGLGFLGPSKIPPGILAYIPILLQNSQPIATVRNYDQQLVVNSSKFAAFESKGLQNVKFFTSTGATVPSWLESGNSNSSFFTVYWLRIAKSIPALGNLPIFMGFGSSSTSFFNTANVGEAPQLSTPYGRYDDGKGVFNFYDNFKLKTSNSAWVANLTGGGSFIRNNGLIVNFGSAPGYFATKKTFGIGTAFDSLVSSFGSTNNLGYVSVLGVLHNTGNGKPNWAGDFIRSDCGRVFPDQWNVTGEANPCGNSIGFLLNGTTSLGGIYSVGVLSLQTSKQSINYSTGNTHQPIAGKYPKFPTKVGFTNQGGSIACAWARVRLSAPNGVMPSVVLGPVHALITIAKGASVSTSAHFFTPPVFTVTPGTTITWLNKDGKAHTVTSNSLVFDSGSISPSGSFSFTLDQVGTYKYQCNFHPWMQGMIAVVSG